MEYYRKRLQQKLSKLGLKQAGVYNSRVPLYETISEMLDKHDALFVPDVSELFKNLIASDRTFIQTDLTRYGHAFGKEYGINVISLNQAIMDVYGSNFIYKNHNRHISRSSHVFYKSRDRLDKFIRKNTSKLELIIVDCNFPVLKY